MIQYSTLSTGNIQNKQIHRNDVAKEMSFAESGNPFLLSSFSLVKEKLRSAEFLANKLLRLQRERTPCQCHGQLATCFFMT